MAVGTVSGITPDNWQLLETITAPGGTTAVTSSVTLTGYSKLMITSAITIGAGDILYIRFNGDTGSNYASTMSRHDGSTRNQDRIATRHGADSNQQNATITIQYANLSAPKLVDSYNSGGNGRATWLTASAITSITFFSGNNLDSGTIKIYGIAG